MKIHRTFHVTIVALLLASLLPFFPPVYEKAYANGNNEIFVSPSGDDQAGDGTLANPYKTLHKAQSVARTKLADMTSDIVVTLRGGDYYLDRTLVLSADDSGRYGHKMVYRNYGSEVPKVHAGTPVTGWEAVPGKPYFKANVGMKAFGSLYENGKAVQVARYPNLEAKESSAGLRDNYFRAKRDSYLQIAESVHVGHDASLSEFKFGPDDRIPLVAKPESLQVSMWPGGNEGEINWFEDRFDVKSINFMENRVALATDARYSLGKGSRYYFQNAIEFLDRPGEFFLDRSQGYVYFYPRVSDINQAVITAPFDGSAFLISGTEAKPAQHIEIRGLDISGTDWGKNIIYLSNAADITITRNRIHDSGGPGMELGNHTHRVVIDNNAIHDIASNGISIWSTLSYTPLSTNHRFTNNHFYNIGKLVGQGSPIYIENGNTVYMANNLMHDLSNQAISQKASADQSRKYEIDYKDNVQTRNNTVEFNEIYSATNDTQDSGPIYTWGAGTPREGFENYIRQNWVHDTDIHFSFGSGGIYLDNLSDRTVIEKNLLTQNQKIGKGIAGDPIFVRGVHNVVRNNVVADNGYKDGRMMGMYPIMNDPDHSTRVDHNIAYRNGDAAYFVWDWKDSRFEKAEYNLFYNEEDSYRMLGSIPARNLTEWRFALDGKHDQYSVAQDPLFMNPEEGDYRLRYDSPAYALGIEDLNHQDIGLTKDFAFPVDEPLKRLFIRKTGDTVNRSWFELDSGQTARLELMGRTQTGFVKNLAGATITYSNNGSDQVATVDDQGVVKAVGHGKARITATVSLEGVTKSIGMDVLVDDYVQSVELLSSRTGFTVSEAKQAHVVGTTKLGRKMDLTRQASYTSSNPEVLNVDENGLLSAAALGQAAITAEFAGSEIPDPEPTEPFRVMPPVFTDMNNQPVTSLEPGTMITGQVSVKNQTEESRQAAVIVGLYNAGHALENVSFVSEVIPAGGTQELGAGFQLPEALDGHYIKTFVWDSLETMQPLSLSYRFPDDGTNPPPPGPGEKPPVELKKTLSMGVYEKVLKSVSAAVSSPTVKVGETAQITVAGKMSDGSGADLSRAQIRYEADNPARATVSETGVLTALGTGLLRVNIYITLDGVTRLTSINVTLFPESGLGAPAGWSLQTYGNASGFGIEDGDGYFLMGKGRDVWGKPDDFVYIYKNVQADINTKVTMYATVDWFMASDANAQLGIMIRDENTADSKHAHFRFRPDGGPRFSWRNDENLNGTGRWTYSNVQTPLKMKMEKIGDEIIVYAWKTLGGNDQYQDYVEIDRVKVVMDNEFMVGLGWFSINEDPIQARVSDVRVEVAPVEYRLDFIDLSKTKSALNKQETTQMRVFAEEGLSGKVVDVSKLQGVTLEYATSDAQVAAVSGTGLIQGVNAGVATVTVTAKLLGEPIGSKSMDVVVFGKRVVYDSFDTMTLDQWNQQTTDGLPVQGDVGTTRSGYMSFSSNQDVAYLTLKPELAANGPHVAELWLYDDGGIDKYMNVSPGEAEMTGVDTSVSSTHYVTKVSGTAVATTVPRQKGWHQVLFDTYTAPGKLTVRLDGIIIGEKAWTGGMVSFELGDNRADGHTAYMNADDFGLYSLEDPVLASMSLAKTKPGLLTGQTLQIVAEATDADGDPINPVSVQTVYVSTNPSAASISSSGLVTGLAAGTTDIQVTMTYNGVSLTQTIQVDVKEQYASLNNLTLGSPVIEVSTHNWRDIQGMTDGNFADESSWNSEPGREHWAIVDLQQTKEISRFVVGHRGYYTTRDFKIYTSLDKVSWEEQVNVVNNQLLKTVHDIYPVQTRYMKIVVTRSAEIPVAMITELQGWGYVDPSLPQRITDGVTIEVDSTGKGNKAALNDKIPSTEWESAHTDSDHWVKYDLGASYLISKLVIHPQSAYYRVKNYYVETSSDGVNWTKAVEVTNNPESSKDIHDLAEPVSARHVRLTTLGQRIILKEFEVWGVLDPSQSAEISPASIQVNKADASDVDIQLKLFAQEFEGILHNGVPVAETSYMYGSETKKVTLKKEFLSSLPAGAQQLVFTFSSGGDQVLAVNVVNIPYVLLSQNKPVTVSSQSAEWRSGSNAVDGNDATKWDSTNTEPPHTLTVDLEAARSIAKFVVKHNGVAESTSALYNTSGYRIETSMDGTNWTPAATMSNNTANTTSHTITPVTARYVRLVVTKPAPDWNKIAMITEFQVFGQGELQLIDPPAADFVKTMPQDITVNMLMGSSTFSGLSYNGTTVTEATYYSVNGSSVTIMKEFFLGLDAGTHGIVFDYSEGTDPVLNVTVKDHVNAAISPAKVQFTKAAPSDAAIQLTLNGNELTGITSPGQPLAAGTDYEVVNGTHAVLKQSYLASLPAGIHVLSFLFNHGAPVSLEVTIVEEALLLNGGFEDGIAGWTRTGTGSFGTNTDDARTGKKLYFWGTAPYEQQISQTISGLANGSYTVKAWVKQNTGTPLAAEMRVTGFGGTDEILDVKGLGQYEQKIITVDVTNHELTIVFYAKSGGSSNLQVDDVELIRNF